MRRKVLISLLAGVTLIGGCFALRAMAPSAPSSAQSQEASEEVLAPPSLTAEGVIVPVRRVVLSFPTGGLLQQVAVVEGEEVAEGILLAALDSAELELAVQEAQEGLALNQALLDQARAGAREQELAIARAEYQRALAQHEQLLAGARPEEIAMAQAAYHAALARYDQVKSGASQEEIVGAQASVEKAEVALKHAQAEYDKHAWQQGFEASPQATALHQATIDYQAAKAQVDRLRNLPRNADLQEAKANVDRAEAQLTLKQGAPTEEELAASTAGVASVGAQLELKEAGPRREDVAVAEARVQQARTGLERARLALSRSQLLAPFTGTVVEVALEEGEMVPAGAPVITLARLAELRVETTDLDEWSAVDVRVGQVVKITVNAFEDEVLTGRVTAIAPRGEIMDTGDTAYTVAIALDRQDPDLRWGMTTKVEFLKE